MIDRDSAILRIDGDAGLFEPEERRNPMKKVSTNRAECTQLQRPSWSEIFWQWDLLPDFSLSVTRESINKGAFVFCRIIGGMSALCFISLTTPMTDIFIAFRQCRIPDAVLDLMMIIYRTIFILMDHVIQIYHAQVMRLGYSGYRESIQSFASLCGAAFIASWDAGDDLIRAMDARCYEGKFALLGESRPVECIPGLTVVVFLALSATVVTMSGNLTLF